MSVALRKVRIIESTWVPGTNRQERTTIGFGLFHGFGVDYEEFEDGPGNYSTAIVEKPDGTILNHPVDQIEFCDPLEQHQ